MRVNNAQRREDGHARGCISMRGGEFAAVPVDAVALPSPKSLRLSQAAW